MTSSWLGAVRRPAACARLATAAVAALVATAPCVAQEPKPSSVRLLAAHAAGELCPAISNVFTESTPVSLAFEGLRDLQAGSLLRCTLSLDLELSPGLHTEQIRLFLRGDVDSFATSASVLVLSTRRHVEGGSGARAEATYRIVNDDFDQDLIAFQFVERTSVAPNECLLEPTKVRVTTELWAELIGPATPGQQLGLRGGSLALPSGEPKPCLPSATTANREVVR